MTVIAVGVVLAVEGRGGTTLAHTSTTPLSETTIAADGLLAGIPQQGRVLGSPNAPLTLEYFCDLRSVLCKVFTSEAIDRLIGNEVKAGELEIQYFPDNQFEANPTETELTWASEENLALLAAGLQDKLWNYLESVYGGRGKESSEHLTLSELEGVARETLGSGLTAWRTAMHSKTREPEVDDLHRVVEKAGIKELPTILIGRTGGLMANPLDAPGVPGKSLGDLANAVEGAIQRLAPPRAHGSR
jgi:hypothetical protein